MIWVRKKDTTQGQEGVLFFGDWQRMQRETSNGFVCLLHSTAVMFLWHRSFSPSLCKMSDRWRPKQAHRAAPHRHVKRLTTHPPPSVRHKWLASLASLDGRVIWPRLAPGLHEVWVRIGGKGLLCGDSSEQRPPALLWGQIWAWLIITVVRPRLELPRTPPLPLRASTVQQAEGWSRAVAQQRKRRRRRQGVEGVRVRVEFQLWVADLPQLCPSEGKSSPEEAPLVPGAAPSGAGTRSSLSGRFAYPCF